MHLNKSTSHAIRILIECALAEDQLTKVADLSARLDITPQNTFKIVHILSRAGFLEAMRGRYGGVRLAGPAADIRIGDVVREIEAGLERDLANSTGAVRGFDLLIDDAFRAFLEVLDGQTLADMTLTRRKSSKPNAKVIGAGSRGNRARGKAGKARAKRGMSARA